MYSLDGLLADEGTEYGQFCFGLPNDPAEMRQKVDVYQSAYAHIMGRVAYEGMAGALPAATDHPFHGVMNAARKRRERSNPAHRDFRVRGWSCVVTRRE